LIKYMYKKAKEIVKFYNPLRSNVEARGSREHK